MIHSREETKENSQIKIMASGIFDKSSRGLETGTFLLGRQELFHKKFIYDTTKNFDRETEV